MNSGLDTHADIDEGVADQVAKQLTERVREATDGTVPDDEADTYALVAEIVGSGGAASSPRATRPGEPLLTEMPVDCEHRRRRKNRRKTIHQQSTTQERTHKCLIEPSIPAMGIDGPDTHIRLMESVTIHEYATDEAFTAADAQHGVSETDQPLVWALLTELSPDEVFLRLPRWLADEKVGYTDGGTPTTFIGQIDRSTDKAIHLIDSAAARPLMKRAHRIQQLEANLTDDSATDDQQRAWLERKLRDHRDTFTNRTERVSLSDEWLPISQIETVIRAGSNTD